jgi:ribosomal protein S1
LTTDPSAKLSNLFKVGDEVRAKVVKVSDIDGVTTLDKLRADATLNWDKLEDYEKSNESVEGKIVECVKGGVIALVDNVRIFIPASLTGVSRGSGIDGMKALVGTTQKLKIVETDLNKKRALGSIRAAIREERKVKEDKFWDEAVVGKVYEGPVKSITSYGAFVDLGGVDGLVHVSELSWERHAKPSDIVSVGQVIKVYIKELDREAGRISLGYKNEDDNPWKIFKDKYKEGDVVKVKINSLLKFGAFAEIVPGVDGLIHISQITDHRIESPSEVLHVGDVVDAKIVSVDNDHEKVNLSMKALIEPEEPKTEEAAKDTEDPNAPKTYSTDDPTTYADLDPDGENK